MNAAVFADDLPIDSEALADRIIRQFTVATEDWADACRKLSQFEQQWLADDPLDEAALAKHARALTSLELLGRLIAATTESPDFPDRQLSNRVAAQLQDLKDRRAMWHTKMPTEKRNQIVREVFDEV
jgi:hypothetical protein